MRTTRSFPQLFSLLMLCFIVLLAASALFAWTGPTATAPSGGTSVPVNPGSSDQIKNAGLSINTLAVFGSAYVQNKLGVGVVPSSYAAEVNGTVKIGNGGEACSSSLAGALRYNSSNTKLEYCAGGAWNSF